MFRSILFSFYLVLAAGGVLVQAQSTTFHESHFGGPKSQRPHQTSMPMPMSMPLVAPLLIEDSTYQSSITMVNELTMAVQGTVIAKGQDGSELARKVITFAPHSQSVLTVSDLLTSKKEQAVGSIELDPDPMVAMNMPIAAQLSIVNTRGTPEASFEEEFITVNPELPSQYRAVVPAAAGSTAIALLRTAMSAQNVSLRCVQENGRSVTQTAHLARGQLMILQACEKAPAFDSMTDDFEAIFRPGNNLPSPAALDVETDGAAGSLAVWGIAVAAEKHQASIALNFSNPAALHTAETIFAGVPIGAADLLPGDSFTPQLAIADFGAKPSNVSVFYAATVNDSTHVETVASLSCPPAQCRASRCRS